MRIDVKSENWHQEFVKAAQIAVDRAIERHRRLGESIVVWRDGKVVVVPPEEIEPRSPSAEAPGYKNKPR